MKTRFLYVLLLFSCFPAGHSQTGFQVIFQSPSDDYVQDIAEGVNNTYFAVGSYRSNLYPWNYIGLIYRIRSASDTFSRRLVFSDTVTRLFRIIKSGEHEFLLLGTICNPPEYTERLFIAKMDTNLSIIWRKEYKLKSYNWFWSINCLNAKNSSLILFGTAWQDSNGQRDVFFVNVTPYGDTIKSGYYLPESPAIRSGVFSPDSSSIWFFGGGFDYNYRGERAEFDTNYVLQRIDWLPELTYGDNGNIVQWYNTQKLLYSGLFPIDPFGGGPQDDDLGMTFMDTALNMNSLHYFGAIDTIDYPSYERNFSYLDTNRIFFAGTKNVFIGFFPQEVSWIMAGLLDHNLNTQYFKMFGGDAYYMATCVLATSDGGSIISATRYDYTTQDFERDCYFLKLDENGLITSDGGSNEINSRLSPDIFPNPGNDIVNVSGVDIGIIEFYSIDGRKILSQYIGPLSKSIGVSNLLPGCYIYRILNKNIPIGTGKWIKL
jgi:hypothetical protein